MEIRGWKGPLVHQQYDCQISQMDLGLNPPNNEGLTASRQRPPRHAQVLLHPQHELELDIGSS